MTTNESENLKEKKFVKITKKDLSSMLEYLKTDNTQREIYLESINEFGYAFLLKWNELELSLKLNYYEYSGNYPFEIKPVLDCVAKSMTNLKSKNKKC